MKPDRSRDFLREYIPDMSEVDKFLFYAKERETAKAFRKLLDEFRSSGYKSVQTFILQCNQILGQATDGHISPNDVAKLNDYLFSAGHRAKTFVFKLFDVLNEVNNAESGLVWENAEGLHFALKEQPFDGIKVVCYSNAVLLKIPLLWARRDFMGKAPGQKNSAREYDNIWGDAIRRAIMYSPTFDHLAPENFSHTHVHFLHVYTEERTFLPDNESRDIKVVLDAVTSFVGGDSAMYCSISASSVTSSEIPEGTYITALAGTRENVPDDDYIMDGWRKYYENQ